MIEHITISDYFFQNGMKFEETFSIQKICVTKAFTKNKFKLISAVGKSQFLEMQIMDYVREHRIILYSHGL